MDYRDSAAAHDMYAPMVRVEELQSVLSRASQRLYSERPEPTELDPI